MALIWRVVTKWSGGRIGSGFTNLFFTEGIGTAQQAATAVVAFFQGCYGVTATALPSGITLTYATSVDVLEPGTGALITTVPVTGTSNMVGADTGVYGAPAGVNVTWRTAGVIAGHRVQGRTFIVPIGASAMSNDGTPANTFVSNVQSAAAALIAAAPELVIWHRPASLSAGGGETFPVLASNVNDRIAMLTSRR